MYTTVNNSHPAPKRSAGRSNTWLIILISFFCGVLFTFIIGIFALPHSSAPANTAQSGSVTIILSPDILDILAERGLAKLPSQIPVSLSQIQFTTQQNGTLQLTAQAHTALGITEPVSFNCAPYISSSGQLRVAINSAQLGGLPVTGFTSAVESLLNSQFDAVTAGYISSGFTYRLTNVEVVSGGLSVTAIVSANNIALLRYP